MPRTPAAAKQCRYRQRHNDGIKVMAVETDRVVAKAIFVQAMDRGLTEKQAAAVSRDRAKAAQVLAAIIKEWALRYVTERNRYG